MKNKTTGHLVSRTSLAAFCVAAFLVAAPTPSVAVEVTFQLANDPISGNAQSDDLYTSAFAVEVSAAKHHWTLGERMFTDRERGLRFDETFLEARREFPTWRGWQLDATAGVLHVGRGLLGQRVQNQVHAWVDSEPVDLPYPDRARWFPSGQLSATRPLWASSKSSLLGHVEAATTPGFQDHLRADIALDHRLGAGWSARVGVGARASRAESKLLGNRIVGLAETFELGVAWRNLKLRVSQNDFGTATRHIALAIHVDPQQLRLRSHHARR